MSWFNQVDAERLKAQEHAISLGIYEIVRNIANNGSDSCKPLQADWEGCQVIFEGAGRQSQRQMQQQQLPQPSISYGTSVVMPDGTFLYHAEQEGRQVTAFRYGAWVERIKAYSEQITAKKQQEAEIKAQQEREAKLKPFLGVDF